MNSRQSVKSLRNPVGQEDFGAKGFARNVRQDLTCLRTRPSTVDGKITPALGNGLGSQGYRANWDLPLSNFENFTGVPSFHVGTYLCHFYTVDCLTMIHIHVDGGAHSSGK